MERVYKLYVKEKPVKTFSSQRCAESYAVEKGILDYKIVEVDVPDVEDLKRYKKERGEING